MYKNHFHPSVEAFADSLLKGYPIEYGWVELRSTVRALLDVVLCAAVIPLTTFHCLHSLNVTVEWPACARNATDICTHTHSLQESEAKEEPQRGLHHAKD